VPSRLAQPILAAALTLITQAGLAQVPQALSAPVPVAEDNFVGAESDLSFAAIVQQGGVGPPVWPQRSHAVGTMPHAAHRTGQPSGSIPT
jgi:hypothetical protein